MTPYLPAFSTLSKKKTRVNSGKLAALPIKILLRCLQPDKNMKAEGKDS